MGKQTWLTMRKKTAACCDHRFKISGSNGRYAHISKHPNRRGSTRDRIGSSGRISVMRICVIETTDILVDSSIVKPTWIENENLRSRVGEDLDDTHETLRRNMHWHASSKLFHPLLHTVYCSRVPQVDIDLSSKIPRGGVRYCCSLLHGLYQCSPILRGCISNRMGPQRGMLEVHLTRDVRLCDGGVHCCPAPRGTHSKNPFPQN